MEPIIHDELIKYLQGVYPDTLTRNPNVTLQNIHFAQGAQSVLDVLKALQERQQLKQQEKHGKPILTGYPSSTSPSGSSGNIKRSSDPRFS